MRDQMNQEELAAMRILDAARAGLDVPAAVVTWALWVSGDLGGVQCGEGGDL